MRNNNQILQGDQASCAVFLHRRPRMLMRDLFVVDAGMWKDDIEPAAETQKYCADAVLLLFIIKNLK